MVGPAINVAAYDPKVAGVRSHLTVQGKPENVACHVELHPIQIEPFGTNEVKISIDGVGRIVDAFALTRAVNEALGRFRGR
jgi:hypothetical protein